MGQNGWRKLLENMNTAANKMNANWRATKMEWKRHVYTLTNCFELKWNSHDKCSNAKDSSKNSSTGISFFEMNLQDRVNIRAKNEKTKNEIRIKNIVETKACKTFRMTLNLYQVKKRLVSDMS